MRGWVKKHPPSHTFAFPRKKLWEKVANFFLLFLNMKMEGWGYFLQPDNIYYGREGAEMVKIASIS